MAPASESVEVDRQGLAVASWRAVLFLLALSGAVSLLASAILSIESFDLAREYAALPDETRPDSFPTPKSLLGVVWLPVVATVGVTGLAGARLPRSFTMAVAMVQLAGVVLAYVFMVQILTSGGGPSFWRWVLTVTATAALVALAWIVFHPSARALSSSPAQRRAPARRTRRLARP